MVACTQGAQKLSVEAVTRNWRIGPYRCSRRYGVTTTRVDWLAGKSYGQSVLIDIEVLRMNGTLVDIGDSQVCQVIQIAN